MKVLEKNPNIKRLVETQEVSERDMKLKTALQAMTSLMTFFVLMPLGWIGTYYLYQHVQAPAIVWIIWIINMPLIILCTILNMIANKIKE